MPGCAVEPHSSHSSYSLLEFEWPAVVACCGELLLSWLFQSFKQLLSWLLRSCVGQGIMLQRAGDDLAEGRGMMKGKEVQEYHEQIHGFSSFNDWHSTMFPGQQLEIGPWKPTVAKDVPFPTMTRSVMYTMCMDVPNYVRSLTSAFNCMPCCSPRPPPYSPGTLSGTEREGMGRSGGSLPSLSSHM